MRPFANGRPPRGILMGSALAVILWSAATTWAIVAYWGSATPEDEVTNRPVQDPRDGYVSSNTCEACHPREYETWHSSYHRTMTQVASTETVLANFSGTRVDAVR